MTSINRDPSPMPPMNISEGFIDHEDVSPPSDDTAIMKDVFHFRPQTTFSSTQKKTVDTVESLDDDEDKNLITRNTKANEKPKDKDLQYFTHAPVLPKPTELNLDTKPVTDKIENAKNVSPKDLINLIPKDSIPQQTDKPHSTDNKKAEVPSTDNNQNAQQNKDTSHQIRASETMTQVPQGSKEDVAKPKELDQNTVSPLKFSQKAIEGEAAMEKDVMQSYSASRTLHTEMIKHSFAEVKLKQHHRKALHQQTDELKDAIAKKAKVSETLKWVNTATTIGLIILSVVSFALSIVTGGVSALFGAVTSILGTASGVMGATQGIMQLQNQEKQGVAAGLTLERELEYHGIDTILTETQKGNDSISNNTQDAIQIQKNKSNVKIFS